MQAICNTWTAGLLLEGDVDKNFGCGTDERCCAALQVAWMNGLMDFVFPYLIQFLKEYSGKVDALWTERKERQEAAVDEESAKKQQEAASNAYLQLMPLALPAPPVPGAAPLGPGGDASFGGGGFRRAAGGLRAGRLRRAAILGRSLQGGG